MKCFYGLPFVASTTLGPQFVMGPFLCTGRLLGDGAGLWGMSYWAVMIDKCVTFLVYTGFPLYCWCQCGILYHFRYGVMSVAMTFSCVCPGDVGGAPWNTRL